MQHIYLTCKPYILLSAHLKTYNAVLKKSINIIKRQYYEACFCKFSDDIKKP